MRIVGRSALALLVLATMACSPPPDTDATSSPSDDPAPRRTTTVATVPTGTAPVSESVVVDSTRFDLVGRSVAGRPLIAATVGDGPRRVYVIGGIHGDERTGVDTSRALLEHVRSGAPGVRVRWLVDANPDGSAARTRDNGNGIDINRNWPTGHVPSRYHGDEPLTEPETRAVHDDIEAFDPDVIVAMHSAREGPFVNYDGPGLGLAQAFADGASASRTWEVVPEVDWPTPGSLGTHYGLELGIPVVTVEGSRWDTPDAALAEFRAGLDALLRAVAEPGPGTAPICEDHRVGHACTELTRRVDEVVGEWVRGGTTGFLLKEAGGLVEAARWADTPIYPASSIKVIHFLHLLLDEDLGADLDASVPVYERSCEAAGTATVADLGELVDRMLLESDNEATNAIQHWIGLDDLNDTATAIGMSQTRIEHGFGCGSPSNRPANTSTIADLVALYDGVATGDVLDGAAREVFFDRMLDISDVVLSELDAAPTSGVRIVAKAGVYGTTTSIGGIAVTPGGSWVFGVYVDRPRSIRSGFRIERLVAELLRDQIASPGS